jgi:uncharacterized protein with HEPN domain
MLDCIHRINEYVESKEQFYDSTLVQDAVVRNLQTMAESSQRLSDSIKNEYHDIPWNNIAGFRNILVHDYLGVDLDMIWSVIEKELPTLETALVKIEQ